MLYLLVLLNAAWVSAIQTDDTSSTFGTWISVLVSRGVYVLLASLIALCFIVTTVRNKLEERAARKRTGKNESWTSSLWKGSNPSLSLPVVKFGQRSLLPHGSDHDSLCDQIKEAEVTINSLKSELDMANQVKIDLENTLELYERQKTSSDDELLKLKIDGALELEALKKEAAITERKLQIALEERDGLERDVESLKREGRITESAIKDQINLTKRLEKARTEIESLKVRVKDMKSERDLAVKLASDLIEKAKGVASRDTDQRRIVEQMIEAEVKKLRLEEELKGANETVQDESYTSTIFENDLKEKRDKSVALTDADFCLDDPSILSLKSIKTERGILVAATGLREKFSNENIDMTFSSLDDNEEDDEESEDKKFVTGSPAFRAFLSSLTQNNDC